MYNVNTKIINTVNGVNVDAVNSTVEAIKGKPGIAKFRFYLHNNWINGGHNRSTVSSFYGANQENIEKLKALSKLSPVFDVTSHGTNVDVRIERN
ncbi:MAG: hypothetical protein ABFR82_03985 [Nitrospirota bacterium]